MNAKWLGALGFILMGLIPALADAQIGPGTVNARQSGAWSFTCLAGCSGGTSSTDDSTFTGGASSVVPLGALYDTTPPSITDGNVGIPRMNSSRQLQVDCVVGCGVTSFLDNAAFTFGTTAIGLSGFVVDDTGTNTVTENSAGLARMNTNRILYTHPTNTTGSTLFPSAFASADNIAAQTATFMHGGLMAWDTGGANWDRLLLTAGALNVNIQNSTLAVTQSGTWTVQPGNTANTTPWLMTIQQGGNAATVTGANALKVDGSAVTQPISAASLPLPTGAATSANQDGIVRDGTGDTTQANVSSGRLHVDGSGVTQPISAAALPLPAGAATSANQDGIIRDGTGDTTQANVTSGRLNVDGSGVTQPVSGTVTANAGTNLNTSALLLDTTFTGRINTQGQKAMAASTPVVVASDQTSLPTTEFSSSAILAGQQAVTASAVALATNTTKEVCVKALIDNALNIYVGPSGVTTSTGIQLAPGDGFCTRVTNTNALFVIASSTGSGVSWAARN